jgi:CRISPR/Cas system-associated exonuclease Cas4 (RecB family)
MQLLYKNYEYNPVLGWSISRYEVFDKCKRQYFFTYYPKAVKNVPHYKMAQLRELTSVPLEIGNVVHDILEAFLKRLQKSDTDIDESRFFKYARDLVDRYFTEKSFLEIYYGYYSEIDIEKAYEKIEHCLKNFIQSPCYNWIYMVALGDRRNWMIEPSGFGETRLNGMKAYCKMDFLLPVKEDIYILDWKTGSKDEAKHKCQLMGYAAAANKNFNIRWDRIFPKIIYLYPQYEEYEIKINQEELEAFFETIRKQTQQMYAFCSSVEQNIPLDIEEFPKNPSPTLCKQCRFRELCFPECRLQKDKEDLRFSQTEV